MNALTPPSRILFVNPYGIGDVLFTTPAVRMIKKHFPEAAIGYLCNERTKVVLESNPLINELFIFEKDQYRKLWRENKRRFLGLSVSFLREIRKKRFDVALDYSLSRQFGFFLSLLKIPVRIGYHYKNRGLFLTQKVEIDQYSGRPMAFFYCRLLEEMKLPVSIDAVPEMQFPVPDSVKEWAERFLNSRGIEEGERFIAVHPGGGASWGGQARYKRWPPAFFEKLIRLLHEYYRGKILLFGDSTDREIVDSMIQGTSQHDVINVCGQMDLLQLAGLFQRAWFVVCNDGGPLHIAVSQGTRTVSFFGPVDEAVYGPFPREGHLVLTHPVECRPCYQNFRFPPCPYEHRCLRELSVEYAFGRIRETFKK